VKVTTGGEKQILRLVEDEAPQRSGLVQTTWPIDLLSAPYRPGELPESLRLDLDLDPAERAARLAGAEGLPVALWLRVAIEAGRARDGLAERTGLPAREIEELLSVGARSGPVAGISALARYGAAILAGRAGGAWERDTWIEVLIPSEMVLSWRMAAAAAGSTLDQWAGAMVSLAPEGVGRLEAEAATAGESLAAWCYAAWVACAEIRSASAQPRT
jgi:hypothetical protein